MSDPKADLKRMIMKYAGENRLDQGDWGVLCSVLERLESLEAENQRLLQRIESLRNVGLWNTRTECWDKKDGEYDDRDRIEREGM